MVIAPRLDQFGSAAELNDLISDAFKCLVEVRRNENPEYENLLDVSFPFDTAFEKIASPNIRLLPPS